MGFKALEELPGALASAERDRLPRRRDLSMAAIAERYPDIEVFYPVLRNYFAALPGLPLGAKSGPFAPHRAPPFGRARRPATRRARGGWPPGAHDIVAAAVLRAADGAEVFLRDGIERVMNTFNAAEKQDSAE